MYICENICAKISNMCNYSMVSGGILVLNNNVRFSAMNKHKVHMDICNSH
jgi:hypothetical protein